MSSSKSEMRSESMGVVIYEEKPALKKVHWRTSALIYGSIAAVFAAVVIAFEIFADYNNWMIAVFCFLWAPANAMIGFNFAKRTRYRIRAGGLEWEVQSSAKDASTFAAWESIVWTGPKPEGSQLRAMKEAWKLSVGRLRVFPPHLALGRPAWRVVHRGKTLMHAVDFYPSDEYIQQMTQKLEELGHENQDPTAAIQPR